MPSPASGAALERTDFRLVLEVLARHRVDFVVVGGVAAALQGAPVSTFDLNLVHSREEANLARLVPALAELGACSLTPAGPLDLLGAVATGDCYAELASHALPLDLGGGLCVRVLDLPAIIRLKERLDRERDRAMLPILRRTLAERSGGSAGGPGDD